ncbi:MAG: hypothetical protein ACP5D9_14705 [Mariniphaga sp.]|jgi:hypothetical protein
MENVIFFSRKCSVKMLSKKDLTLIDGGNPAIWFLGALAGGLVYDLWKATGKAYLESYREHSEYFEGIPHGI